MVASKFKQMLQDENGVSPVIGVILMVAVTVVLGAVIGAFVFGIGDSLGQPAPNAQIAFDYDNSNDDVVIRHDGGDSITADNTGLLSVNIAETINSGNVWGPNLDGTTNSDLSNAAPTGTTAANGLIFDTSVDTDGAGGGAGSGGVAGNVAPGDEVTLQWESVDGGTSSTLGTFEA